MIKIPSTFYCIQICNHVIIRNLNFLLIFMVNFLLWYWAQIRKKQLVFILFDKKILHAKMIRKNICLELDKKNISKLNKCIY